MRNGLVLCVLLLGWMAAASAEEEEARRQPPVSTYTFRTGEQLQAPHALTYRLFEYSQQRGRWILPDFGAWDAGHGDVRLLFTGVGAEFRPNKRVDLTQIVYVSQAVGPGSRQARALWLWPVLDLVFTPQLTAEVVAYPTIPLNRGAQAGFDLDRAKVEYALRRGWLAGAGFSGSICKGGPWQNKPFATTTVTTRAGSIEFWLERIPGGGQVQARYQLVRGGR